MRKMNFLDKLATDYPQFKFAKSDDFYWSPFDKTIHFTNINSNQTKNLLFHELAHALLDHTDYTNDVQLVQMETEAWAKVRDELSAKYNIKFEHDLAENVIDTYRDWLHKRSLCPNCNINGFQIDYHLYKCPSCANIWKVNSAKFTQLRRYPIKNR